MANMDQKRVQRVTEVVTPLLAPGERLELCSLSTVGSVSLGRKAATAAVAGILTGGLLLVSVRPRAFYFALTDRRVIFFGVDPLMSRKPEKKPAMQLSRASLRAGEPKRGMLTTTVMMEIADQPKGLKFVFPRQMRDDAPTFVSRINGVFQP